MFGIGFPELVFIMAVALIVVGPEKLPELARGLAKQIVELKKAANALKESLNEEESEKEALNKDLPIGFSRPEELAAAARENASEEAAFEESKEPVKEKTSEQSKELKDQGEGKSGAESNSSGSDPTGQEK
jgi:sec-independent protein translocase protein TatB